jgi:hypothetical protein
LEALLARYWPEFAGVMDLQQTRSWMSLLRMYAGPEAVLQAGEDAKQVLWTAARGVLSKDRLEQVVACAQASLGVPMQSEERALLAEVVGEMQRLRGKVDEIDGAIASHVRADPVLSVMSRVVGQAAAAALIVYVGAPEQYASARAYEKACGLNLKVRSSGKHQGRTKITKRGPPRVRQLLYLAALRCCQSDEIVCTWYEQRAGYKAGVKKKAIVAVMRKLVRALWCMGHDAEDPKAFDSHLLFDTRRLPMKRKASANCTGQADAARASSCSPGQTGRRTGRVPPLRRSSVQEVTPQASQ